MPTNKKIRSLSLIIERLTRNDKTTAKDIKTYLQRYDIDISNRTFERYMQDLRDDFGLMIDCNRSTNTYSIDKENNPELDLLLHFIHLFNTAELLANGIKNKDQISSYLAFETNYGGMNSNRLELIYSAIVHSKIISFNHENYEHDKISHRSIKPYLLKEYNSNWYVVGTFVDSTAIRIFGLDRISDVEITDEFFEKTEQKKISNLFDNLIGLVYDLDKPTTVWLSVTPGQAKYFKKSPLHPSQEIESETEEGVIFSYWLIPNRELQRLILGYSSQIKVLKPEWFVNQIKEEIQKMADLYQK